MKNKQILTGILSFVLVFGLGMALTSCGPQTAEISVTNASQFQVDATVTVRVYMNGRGDPLATQEVSKNQTGTFSLDAGEYQVRVTSGSGSSAYYPQDTSFIKMSGDVKLRYDGSSVKRTN
jgi:lipopolysaccharide export system protein LptA